MVSRFYHTRARNTYYIYKKNQRETPRIIYNILSTSSVFSLTHQKKDIEKGKKLKKEVKMSGLSDKKKKEFIEAFSLFDKDGDKKISEEELANVSISFRRVRKTSYHIFFL